MPGFALMRRGVRGAGLAALCASVSFGVAEASPDVGWVLARGSSLGESYTPDPAYSYNTSPR
jgi:hypothetical protein